MLSIHTFGQTSSKCVGDTDSLTGKKVVFFAEIQP
ncbi:hypothetical protein Solca_4427 [Solitalea canadensis DSM 3403]|uniref:Uncharacterized protein n=1 Tax=Solitalea canadensis (strain ATCC 29591 / DSM 3403 / JCM 21819 / LMG 8368 / NBRC 15130 / NCIMB 12057 / USAM 9D) TaxID=929556 RepID=H8KN84_SOLCM|nr:hypothetical protein Solca_4427 [Solitalea canadensis DSM 3403]